MNSEFELNFQIVGSRIREIRDAKKIKLKDVCESLNVAKATVGRLENGLGASIEVFFSYLNYLKNEQNIFIPDLFEEDWNVQEVIAGNKLNTQEEVLPRNFESDKKLSSYSTQIKNILMVQRDKSYQEFNDLIDLAAKIERIYS